jgi:small redox-active disulfide protein 2
MTTVAKYFSSCESERRTNVAERTFHFAKEGQLLLSNFHLAKAKEGQMLLKRPFHFAKNVRCSTNYIYENQTIRIMEIKILGTGCSSCKALYATVENVVKELGIKASVIKEENMEKILSYNVMSLPALVIDEKVVAKGRLSESEVKQILEENK